MRDAVERLRRFWDADADTYDTTKSHAAADPLEAAAWRATLARHLPEPPARILDCGAGTGTMTLLAADLGHRMTALDLSAGMLAKLREKAAARGVEIEVVEAPAHEPPEGPFDAAMARHLVWTLPNPVEALSAWRRVAKRLLLLEGEWGRDDPVSRARHAVAKGVRRALNTPPEHHRPYEPELLGTLPFAKGIDAHGILDAVEQAGWRAPRIERLYDIEWARSKQNHPALRPFEGVPHFAIVADA